MLRNYSESVRLIVDGKRYSWNPEDGLRANSEDPIAINNEQVMTLFLLDMQKMHGVNFPATPEGPFLPTTTASLHTTMFLLNKLFPDSKIESDGPVPSMADMGLAGPRYVNGQRLID